MKKIVIGLIFSSLLLGACGNTTSSTNSDAQKTIDSLKTENSNMNKKIKFYESLLKTDESSSSTETSKTENQSATKLSLNQTLELGDEKKQAEIKVIEATTNQSAFPEHMISLDNYDTTKMVAVTIEYTNVAMDDNFLPYSSYFQAFSDDGQKLEQVNQQNGQDAVSMGRTGKTQLFWELPVEGSQFNHMEIDFVPSDKKVATFDINVNH
ncbi:hypothetical protein IGJ63_000799 [Enterococcus sp. DIV1375a]|uniref:hypothetical protein n=1 Tax=Enterococcus sp. DIV1375a TaxID=2774755 RepID=UPI003F296A45